MAATAQLVDAPRKGARQSLSTVAYQSLRQRVRRGEFGPEDRLVDTEIAAQLGVSRMPVREALLQLVAEGYLTSTARGYRMPTLSLQDVREVFELRQLLEPHAAGLAARDLDRGGVARLGAALAQAKLAVEKNDFSRLYLSNIEFRETWIGAVHNSRLAATIARFGDQIMTVRHSTLHEPAIQTVVLAGLEELHRHFSRHDSIAAQGAMLRFVLAAERAFIALAGGNGA